MDYNEKALTKALDNLNERKKIANSLGYIETVFGAEGYTTVSPQQAQIVAYRSYESLWAIVADENDEMDDLLRRFALVILLEMRDYLDDGFCAKARKHLTVIINERLASFKPGKPYPNSIEYEGFGERFRDFAGIILAAQIILLPAVPSDK